MTAARHLWAALALLDRQIVDRDGYLAGKVDDVELEERDGALLVTGLLVGRGALARRLGLRAFERGEPGVVPLARVADIGDHVTVSLGREELATFEGERWVGEHVIGRVPGADHAAG